MDWVTAAALGMVGGGIVEAVAVWGNLTAWQRARHRARSQGRALPKLTRYVDPAADSLVAISRPILGALAVLLLHAQVSGTISAIAVGASAPALLGQLGGMHTVRVRDGTPAETGAPARFEETAE
jgi:hypothetical protein